MHKSIKFGLLILTSHNDNWRKWIRAKQKLLSISLAVDPFFSLIILKQNVGWLSFFGTKLMKPLPNSWLTQHIYLYINNGVYSCKLRWSQVYSTNNSDELRENEHLTQSPPPSITHLSPYKLPYILPYPHWTL